MHIYIRKKKKQAITLLEIMIVIFLIGLIGSVIGYNVKGSLEEGKAFRSEQGIAKLKDILLMEIASGISMEDILENPKFYLARTGLVVDADKLLKDGWGQPYLIAADKDSDLSIKSEALSRHKAKRNKKAPSSRGQDASSDSSDEK